MKQTKNILLLISLLVMLSVWGFVVVYEMGFLPQGLDIFIFALIAITGVYAFVTHTKKNRDFEKGIPVEDEMSLLIKYKAGHHAFLASLYMWLLIFIFKDLFPDVETMLGGGILFSAFMSMGIRSYMNRHFNEDPA